MIESTANRSSAFVRCLLVPFGVVMLLSLASCNSKQEAPAVQAGPKTFATPEDAGKALAAAAQTQNSDDILQIFGPGSADLVSTGDSAQDKASLKGFAEAYQAMNRWRKLADGTELLFVGTDNHAFPIPLMKNAQGQWYFDVPAGKDELLSRRIGSNELTAIAVCTAITDAQAQYFGQRHDGVKQYAQKFISESGQQNGLYWESPAGAPRSPLGPLVAYATAQGYNLHPNQHQPFNGYYFVMLDKQGSDARGGAKNYIVNGKMTGGFAVAAYPAEYGNSGIMTFMTDQNGVVLEKDLGKTTDQIAAAMTEFNPDNSWKVVE